MKKICFTFVFTLLFISIALFAQEEGITVKQNNIGIGTTNPQASLHITGQIAPELVIEFEDTTGGYGEFQLRDQNSKKWSIGTYRNSSSYPNSFYIFQYTDSLNDSVNKQRFTIDDHGNVGINTLAPAYQLHMQGDSHRIAQIESTNGGATQLRLKSTSSNNRRLIGETDTQVKNQISFENSDLKIYGQTPSINPLNIRTDGSNNVGFNQVSSFGTSANGVIGIGEGTAPTSSPANMVQLYVDNTTSSSAELKVRDEAGNVTILSNSQLQNLSYTAGTRQLNISSGTGATLPLFTSSQAGLSPASGGDTLNYLRADGNWVAPVSSLSYLSATLSSNVSLSSTNTWYNGPTVQLTSGTWLVNCNLTLHGNLSTSSTDWYGRISTGSTHYIGSQVRTSGTARVQINLSAIITVSSTTTIYGQARHTNQNSGSPVIKASENVGGSFPVTNITAIRIN